MHFYSYVSPDLQLQFIVWDRKPLTAGVNIFSFFIFILMVATLARQIIYLFVTFKNKVLFRLRNDITLVTV